VANGKLNFTQSENKPSQAADEKDKAAPAAWEICNKIMLKENLRHRTGKFRKGTQARWLPALSPFRIFLEKPCRVAARASSQNENRKQ